LSDSANAGDRPHSASKTVITTQRKLRMAILVSFIAQSHSGGDVVLHFKATAAPVVAAC
jgi:hypothetical protein